MFKTAPFKRLSSTVCFCIPAFVKKIIETLSIFLKVLVNLF